MQHRQTDAGNAPVRSRRFFGGGSTGRRTLPGAAGASTPDRRLLPGAAGAAEEGTTGGRRRERALDQAVHPRLVDAGQRRVVQQVLELVLELLLGRHVAASRSVGLRQQEDSC